MANDINRLIDMLFERIEDEYDVVVAEEAYQEYLENPKTYTHEDVKGLLDL